MDKKIRYIHVVNPGFLYGTSSFLCLEVSRSAGKRNDWAEESESGDEPREATKVNRNWMQAVVRLPQAFRSFVHAQLGRKTLPRRAPQS